MTEKKTIQGKKVKNGHGTTKEAEKDHTRRLWTQLDKPFSAVETNQEIQLGSLGHPSTGQRF